MLKAIQYAEGFTTEGASEALLVQCIAPWQGKNQCVLIHLADPVLLAGDIWVRHHHRNGLSYWETTLFREDPFTCPDAYNVIITTPVSLKHRDWISVVYPNPSDIYVTCQITLETT